jgi:hypothetical protein
MVMENKPNGSKSILTTDQIQFNPDVKDESFTQRCLVREWRGGSGGFARLGLHVVCVGGRSGGRPFASLWQGGSLTCLFHFNPSRGLVVLISYADLIKTDIRPLVRHYFLQP